MTDSAIPPDATPPWIKEQRVPTMAEVDAWLCEGLTVDAQLPEPAQPGPEDQLNCSAPEKDSPTRPPNPEPVPKVDVPPSVYGASQAKDFLQRLYSMLGSVTLLSIPLKKKKPVSTGWQKLSYGDTQQPKYRRKLERTVERGGNIGVVLGPASDHLCAIDIDDDQNSPRLCEVVVAVVSSFGSGRNPELPTPTQRLTSISKQRTARVMVSGDAAVVAERSP
jgi:hypothetical protein